jgi:uncharacterized protein (TIGR02453 family)
MEESGHFSPELFAFLRELSRNNSKGWFESNKKRYLLHARDPFLRFISDFGPHLARISASFIADPRPVGGSMFRIHRDTRFSHDKSPYKTNLGASFHHAAGKRVHAPGFYLHLAPGMVFVAGGVWHPDPPTQAAIRAAIAAKPEAWLAVSAQKTFREKYSLEGDSLKRPPQGFDPQHPLIEDLKRKDFIAAAYPTEADACRPDFIETVAHHCREMAPLVEFLTHAVGLDYRTGEKA